MANFSNAQTISVNVNNQFLGDSTARLRSTKSIDINGFIDNRSNTDLIGVSGALTGIQVIQNSLISDTRGTEEILINGINFGSGKIVSANFPSASQGLDSQIIVGQYSASVEIYEDGDATALGNALDGLSINDTSFLEEFSESFSATRGDNNSYDFSHDVSIKYLSGIEPDGAGGVKSVQPLPAARTLASAVFNQTFSSFDFDLGDPSSYDYNSLAKKYYNETYDLENGSASFQKRFSLARYNGTNYSAAITTSLNMNDEGIITVSEKGEVKGRANDQATMVNRARAGAETEIASNSYNRCNTVYGTYKSYLHTNTRSLVNSKISISKNYIPNNGSVNYEVTYTDNINISNISVLEERTIDFEESTDGVSTVKEKGSVTGRDSKFSYTLAQLVASVPSPATAKSRCAWVYYKNKKLASTTVASNNLKNLKKSMEFGGGTYDPSSASSFKGGKTVSYEYQFTDDPNVYDTGLFSRYKITTDDTMGAVKGRAFVVPNTFQALYHTSNQTDVSTRKVNASCQLRRLAGNNFTSPRSMIVPYKTIWSTLSKKGLLFLAENPNFTYGPEPVAFGGPPDPYNFYLSDTDCKLNHDNSFDASLTYTIIGNRGRNEVRKILNK